MLPDGRSQVFAGKLEDYQRLAKNSGFPDVLDPSNADDSSVSSIKEQKSSSSPALKSPIHSEGVKNYSESEISAMKKEIQRLEKRGSEIDAALTRSQSRILFLQGEMAKPGMDFSKIAVMNEESSMLEAKNLDLEEEWLQIGESSESLKNLLKSLGRQ
jgi:predicted RNase H-like nuclease (RuvC/YqgF family)